MAKNRKANLTEERQVNRDLTRTESAAIPEPEVDEGQEGLIGEPSAEQKEQAPNPTPKTFQETNIPEEHIAFKADDVVLPDHTFVGPVVTGHKPQPLSDAEMESASEDGDGIEDYEASDGNTIKMAHGRYHVQG